MAHSWRFVRSGGFDQVQIQSGRDLVAIGELDQKLWVALSCPVKGLELDERTLSLVDGDGDGRIRANELIAAVKWASSLLADVEVLADGKDALTLSTIDTANEEGRLLKDTANTLLQSLGKGDSAVITADDVKAGLVAFARRAANGDGIVPPEAAPDPFLQEALKDAVACTVSPPMDRCEKAGIDRESLAAFFSALAEYEGWLTRADQEPALRVCPDMGAAFAAYQAASGKVDDYFARCRVAAYDARALSTINREEKEYASVLLQDLDREGNAVAHFPLAIVGTNRVLPLRTGINPAWSARIEALRTRVLEPLLGPRDALNEADWLTVKAKLLPFETYLADKKGDAVEKLGRERVRALLASDARARIEALIREDDEAAPHAKALASVERLVRYKRDLLELANNFVCFRDFYSRKRPAAFQTGTLYIDTRACELSLRVTDAAKNAKMAALANSYLLYCDCVNAKKETLSIVAAVTGGDVDNLMVGRNGVFYDRKGGEWDATVTRVVDHPISVREAFWTPYKKAVRLIEEQVQKRVADADTEANARMTTAVGDAQTAAKTGAVTPAPTTPRKLDIGVVAALGVAVGGITAAFGALLQAFFGLGIWMPLGVLGLMLAISGPSMAIAWLKLRKRNLGPLLDANGWAVNAQARINVPLGASLTKLGTLPANATRDLRDPYATKKSRVWLYLLTVVLLLLAISWFIGRLDSYLPPAYRSVTVLGENAPAAGVDTK